MAGSRGRNRSSSSGSSKSRDKRRSRSHSNRRKASPRKRSRSRDERSRRDDRRRRRDSSRRSSERAKKRKDIDHRRSRSNSRNKRDSSLTSKSRKSWSRTFSAKTDAQSVMSKLFNDGEEKEMRSQKVSLAQFGKNNFDELYNYNLHIRICLNAAKIKRAGMPKANTLPLSKLYNEGLAAGLHMDWCKRNIEKLKKKKFVCLFDRPEITAANKKREEEASSNLSDRFKTLTQKEREADSQKVVLDERSLRRVGEEPKIRPVQSRVGSRRSPDVRDDRSRDRVSRRSRSPLTEEQKAKLDPKWVPRTGRYFLHDDREDNDYFGSSRSDSPPGRRTDRSSAVPRRMGNRPMDRAPLRRRSSPQMWSHDKFFEEVEGGGEHNETWPPGRENWREREEVSDEPARFKPADQAPPERFRNRLGERRRRSPERKRSPDERRTRKPERFSPERPFYEQIAGSSPPRRKSRSNSRDGGANRRKWGRSRSRSNRKRSKSPSANAEEQNGRREDESSKDTIVASESKAEEPPKAPLVSEANMETDAVAT